MKAIEFDGVNVRIAEDQPEYQTLPAQVGVLPMAMPDGSVAGALAVCSCFELDAEELEEVKKTGKIYLTVLTFGQPLQPIHSTIFKPQFIPDEKCN